MKPIHTGYDANRLPERPVPAGAKTIQQVIAGVHKPLDEATVIPHNPFSTGRHN